jgi:hypothetical protein
VLELGITPNGWIFGVVLICGHGILPDGTYAVATRACQQGYTVVLS